MRAYCDLHLHSCLSPCGDEAMTPGNIAGMARLKGLDLIAVTDHNTARQLPAVEACCREMGVNLLPGIELNTREEVHLLAYFHTVPDALAFSDRIYSLLPDIPNMPDFFGRQVVIDAEDQETGVEPRLLISALDMDLDGLIQEIRVCHGLPVPRPHQPGFQRNSKCAGLPAAGRGLRRAGGVGWPALLRRFLQMEDPPLLRRPPARGHVRARVFIGAARAHRGRFFRGFSDSR